ncbi:MAG: hypothetical protein KC503_25975 [Myxococcales bacterium]|nr:hypothetical protein [Myxococcales bacterium]
MHNKLTFFVELETPELLALFDDPRVEDGLAQLGASLSMCMLDMSPERAELLRRLDARGIAVTAWLVLDEALGYWLTADNADAALDRFYTFDSWNKHHTLAVRTIGLDVETPRDDAIALMRHGMRALRTLLRNRRSRSHVHRAVERYAQIVDEIRRSGYVVESYQIPLIVDERAARSSLLQRALGFVDFLPDREVLMLYRSMLPELLGAGLIEAFGEEADAIAVGITGGGVEFVRDRIADRLLDLDTLLDELERACRYTNELYIFSLEGCVQSGYFEAICQRLPEMLQRPPSARAVSDVGVAQLAQLLRAGLRLALRGEALLDWLSKR